MTCRTGLDKVECGHDTGTVPGPRGKALGLGSLSRCGPRSQQLNRKSGGGGHASSRNRPDPAGKFTRTSAMKRLILPRKEVTAVVSALIDTKYSPSGVKRRPPIACDGTVGHRHGPHMHADLRTPRLWRVDARRRGCPTEGPHGQAWIGSGTACTRCLPKFVLTQLRETVGHSHIRELNRLATGWHLTAPVYRVGRSRWSDF